MAEKTAITPTREEDFPEWYQQVVKAGSLAENSPVRGSMVVLPWGYAIWENIQKELDGSIKRLGHENAYFPLFIPLSFLEKEAAHVAGFAKECAVVTHHRLEEKNGKLVPTGQLEEPLIVRPTSETIIGDCYSRWVESWRDLPIMINQWANVVRWEMRPRIFLRTTEFLWQEGHTVHETEKEAREETMMMLENYRRLMEDFLAIPVIAGEKSAGERFPGADSTYTLEAMMQDRKALQSCTSHYLGQNFAKASGIRFTNREGVLQHAYTTSWGLTTRTIGALIMTHADDDGLRLPPRVAPKQVVIIPVVPKPEMEAEVMAFAKRLVDSLEGVSVHIDKREMRGGEKSWDWIKKGVPIRIEVGPRDIESGSAMVARRDRPHKEKEKVTVQQLKEYITKTLQNMQEGYLQSAREFQKRNIHTHLKTFADLKSFFAETPGGFVLAKWCGDPETESVLKDLQLSIRCLPLAQSGTAGSCILSGRPATVDAIFAKSY